MIRFVFHVFDILPERTMHKAAAAAEMAKNAVKKVLPHLFTISGEEAAQAIADSFIWD